MLKKVTLTFVKFMPFVLIGLVFLKYVLLCIFFCMGDEWFIEDAWYIDTLITTVLIIGFIILSHTFNFCVYHRLPLYCLIVYYMFYDYLTSGVRLNLWFYDFMFFLIFILLFVLSVIYIYVYHNPDLNKKQKWF